MYRFSWIPRFFVAATAVGLSLGLVTTRASGQEWTERVRGSWVQPEDAGDGDVVLVDRGQAVSIVVAEDEALAVQ